VMSPTHVALSLATANRRSSRFPVIGRTGRLSGMNLQLSPFSRRKFRQSFFKSNNY
jgi:hypothetical protein